MIEMIGELVAGILGLIKKGDLEKASLAMEHAFQDMLREDASFFTRIPVEDLTDQLIGEHNYTHGHLEILSELFYAQAELSMARGMRQDALDCYRRSLKLIDFVMREARIFSLEKQSRISRLKDQIALLEGS